MYMHVLSCASNPLSLRRFVANRSSASGLIRLDYRTATELHDWQTNTKL